MDTAAPEEARLIAAPMLIASHLFAFHRSSISEPELLALSLANISWFGLSTECKDDRLAALLGSMSRKGEWSESGEKFVIVGGKGEPSVFFAR